MADLLPPGKESFTIGEASRLTGLKPHVLRYWEAGAGVVRPARRGSGHRRFSRRDVENLQRVRSLVDRGFTLKGARRFLREEARRGPEQIALGFAEASAAVEALKGLKKEIADLVKGMKAHRYSGF